MTYDERSFILDPGDIVVFHSDGIGDAQNAKRRIFRPRELIAELVIANQASAADGIADRILEEADNFSGGKHPADDRTLVVLKVQ